MIKPVDLHGEEWRAVAGFPGYDVSNLGRVRSWHGKGFGAGTRRTTPRIMVGETPSRVYRCLELKGADGKGVTCQVSVLVAAAFIGPRPPGMEAAHENGQHRDDRASNISYKTPLENAADRRRHGRDAIGSRNGAAVLTEEKARIILRAKGTQTAIARRSGVSQSMVSLIKLRKNWKHL